LHDIQDHALAGKDDARIMNDHRNRLSLTQANAIEDFSVAGDFGMRGDGTVEHGENIQDAMNATQA